MGIPNYIIQPLQKIQNFAARLVLLAPPHHHSTLLLEKLHWLPISERIKYDCMSTLCLVHYALLLTPACWKSNNTNARLIAFAPSLALDPTFGIHSHKILDTAQPCHLLKTNWKPSSSPSISILIPVPSFCYNHCVCVCVCVCACMHACMCAHAGVCVCVFVVCVCVFWGRVV